MEQPVMSSTVASKAGDIKQDVKEAVAESVLNDIFRRVSGHGDYGSVVIGEKPTDMFTSGFLIALDPDQDEDQARIQDMETNPVKISATGMDVGIRAEVSAEVKARPGFSVYVRVLPGLDDLQRDRHPVKFTLTNDIRRRIREQVMDRCNRERGDYNLRKARDRERWAVRQAEIRQEVGRSFGIGLDPQGTMPEDEQNEEGGQPGGTPGMSIYTIAPGDPRQAPDDLFDRARPVDKWVRLDVEPPALDIDPSASARKMEEAVRQANDGLEQAVRQRIEKWLESEDPETGGKLWAYPQGRTFTPEEIRQWGQTLESIRREILSLPLRQKLGLVAPPIDNLAIRWSVQVEDDWSDSSQKSMHIALENWSRIPGVDWVESDQSVFQVWVEAEVPKSIHLPMRLERVKPSYRYNAYLTYPALGYNCGIKAAETDDVVSLQTTWVPTYRLPRIDPQEHGIDTSFSEFARRDGCRKQAALIASSLKDYIGTIEASVDVTRGLGWDQDEAARTEKKTFEEDKAMWDREADMIKLGADLLAQSMDAPAGTSESAPFEAFSLMNRTMASIAKGYKSWRLFQIAFILATLPSLASRVPVFAAYHRPDRDNATTLLYFATGGGKTEAFLGLLVFGLFLDRLRGKKRGVTSMIRYPLRLLTIQQAQRAAKFLAEAERIRVGEGISGDPFNIGFWVGGNNTPNRLNDPELTRGVPLAETETRSEADLLESDIYSLAVEKWVKLAECPFCGHHPVGIRRFRSLGGQAGYVCEYGDCWWNINNPGRPLPFHFVDDDIYALSPSVLLGTVDKLALIGQHFNTIRRVLGLFGAATWVEEGSCRFQDGLRDRAILQAGPAESNAKGVFPAYANGESVFFDPFPSLIIQDEAHLLEESLGTFAGLFETALYECFNRLGVKMNGMPARDGEGRLRMPKVVVASATVSEPERQIGFLYQQKLIHFPYPGPDLYWSFYAAPRGRGGQLLDAKNAAGDIEAASMNRRVYASVLTNGKPHTTATVNILSAFHLNMTSLMCDLGSSDRARQDRGRSALIDSLPPGGRRSDYKQVIEQATASDLITMVDMHRVALTYVTNKKGGDQIMSAESQQVLDDHQKKGFDLQDRFDPALITGSVDVGKIKQIVDKAQDRPGPGKPFQPVTEVLRSIVATSAVSHGVDVEELNTMFFAGMPSDIAEYIQASSRVGRTHVGISILIPIPQRKRDRYIVEIHDIFHRFLERMVRPAAIDRWAENAIRRVVPSFFQTYMCGVRPLTQFMDLPESDKGQVKQCVTAGQIASIQRTTVHREVADFICKSIGLYSHFSPPAGSVGYYEDLVEAAVRDLLDDVYNPGNASLTLAEFFDLITRDGARTLDKPMVSLRDVDQPGKLVPRKRAGRLSEDQMKDLMRFLLKGAGATSESLQ